MLPCLLEIDIYSVEWSELSKLQAEKVEHYSFIIKLDLRKPRDTNVSWKSTGKFFFVSKYPAFLEFWVVKPLLHLCIAKMNN